MTRNTADTRKTPTATVRRYGISSAMLEGGITPMPVIWKNSAMTATIKIPP
ncbi:MAG: hypothetical protein RR728_03765 [Oscillospiraceae bacterium]